MRRMIRAHTTATMLAGERATPLRFIVDGATGTLVAPIERELLELDDYLLMLPDESFDALQLHVEPVVFDQRHDEASDRHMAYHGLSDPSAWVRFKIFSAKGNHPTMGPLVVDGAELVLTNPLRSVEARACKLLNSDPLALAALCRRACGITIERPLAVGVDPDGLDVRAKFGIVRVELDPSIDDAELLTERLTRLLHPPG